MTFKEKRRKDFVRPVDALEVNIDKFILFHSIRTMNRFEVDGVVGRSNNDERWDKLIRQLKNGTILTKQKSNGKRFSRRFYLFDNENSISYDRSKKVFGKAEICKSKKMMIDIQMNHDLIDSRSYQRYR